LTDRGDVFDNAVKRLQQEIEKEERALYSKKVLEEANDPQNVGRMQGPDAAGVVTGPCGDTMEFYIRVRDENIEEIVFYTDGCGASIACGSITTRLVKGKPIQDAKALTDKDILEALDGLPEENLHCAKLAADTLHNTIRNLERARRGDE
jgi:nitrogen fixation NifU-like protein